MNKAETAMLVFTRLHEKDGMQSAIDMAAILEAIELVMPSDEERKVLEIYQKRQVLHPSEPRASLGGGERRSRL